MQAIDHSRSETHAAGTPTQASTMSTSWPRLPDFHHAAAHKIFHYWSKLSVNRSLPNVKPLELIKQMDDKDSFGSVSRIDGVITPDLHASVVLNAVESLFEHRPRLPFVLKHLLTFSGLSKDVCLGVFNRHLAALPGYDAPLVLKNQETEELLLQTVALKHLAGMRKDRVLSSNADESFRCALERVWLLQSEQSVQALPFKFLFVIILHYLYGRPYHALHLLQILEVIMYKTSMKGKEDV